MKTNNNKLLLLALALMALIPLSARAQFAVIDIARIKQAQLQHQATVRALNAIRERQDQQITILTQQLAQLTFMAQVMGNPLTNTTPVGGEEVIGCLSTIGVDKSRSDILSATEAALAVAKEALNIYQTIGETFQTHDGKTASRNTSAYRSYAAITGAAANHDAVAANVKERRERLRSAMRDTVQKIAQAGTSTEVQKLQSVLSAQMTEIESADKEQDFATSKVVIQDVENRNEQEKQATARREEQAAEISSTMNHVREALRPNTKPLYLKK